MPAARESSTFVDVGCSRTNCSAVAAGRKVGHAGRSPRGRGGACCVSSRQAEAHACMRAHVKGHTCNETSALPAQDLNGDG